MLYQRNKNPIYNHHKICRFFVKGANILPWKLGKSFFLIDFILLEA